MLNKFPPIDFDAAKPQYRIRLGSSDSEGSSVIVEKILPKKRKSLGLLQLGSFALAGVTLVLVLQGLIYLSKAKNASGEILGAATSAYADLNSAGKNLGQQNLGSAQELFGSAQAHIKSAQDQLNNFKPLTWLTPQGNSADHILNGAGFLAQAGSKLTASLDLFGEFKISSQGVETENFTDKMQANKLLLSETRDLVAHSEEEFNRAGSVPLDYAGTLDLAKSEVAQLKNILDKLIGLEDLYLNIFGANKTYLLVFQNYDEARATGGFIGTYGVLKTNNGKILKLKIDSIYNLDSRIYEQIAAPGPFQPEIPRWGIRDANWFADFPTSAKKLLYFFEKGGETADGVISATPQVFEDLLKLAGPVTLDQYEVTLNPDNFQETVQFKTSIDYDHAQNDPKQFLADFAPKLLDQLTTLPKDKWFDFFQVMQDNLNQKQVLVYSKDTAVQGTIENLGFSGRVLPTDYDYLSIVNSNLGGTKTDLKTDENVSLNSKILSDGSILNTLTIARKNNNDQNNKDYMRVLVPIRSQIISVSGFDDHAVYSSAVDGKRTDPDLAAWDQGESYSNIFVRAEAGKTEFAGWLDVLPQTERMVTITYMLPFKVGVGIGEAQSYSLLLQKQSGSRPINFTGQLNLGKYSVNWTSAGITNTRGFLDFNSHTNTDDFWGFVITK